MKGEEYLGWLLAIKNRDYFTHGEVTAVSVF